jgi:hypothetical protein
VYGSNLIGYGVNKLHRREVRARGIAQCAIGAVTALKERLLHGGLQDWLSDIGYGSSRVISVVTEILVQTNFDL